MMFLDIGHCTRSVSRLMKAIKTAPCALLCMNLDCGILKSKRRSVKTNILHMIPKQDLCGGGSFIFWRERRRKTCTLKSLADLWKPDGFKKAKPSPLKCTMILERF